MEQRFPKVRTGTPDTWLDVQRYTGPVRCSLSCGTLELKACPEEYGLVLRIVPDPQVARFEVSLHLLPHPKEGAYDREVTQYAETRMTAVFLAHDDSGPQYPQRRPHTFTAGKNEPPTGQHSFSQQLRDVEYRTLPEAVKAGLRLPLFPGSDAKDHVVFSWQGIRFPKLAFSRPTEGMRANAVEAAKTFRAIMMAMENGSTLHVVFVPTKGNPDGPRVVDTYWPFFASLPAPVPESYWAWIKPLCDFEADDTTLNFCGRHFERDQEYIDKALSIRGKNWYVAKKATTEDVNVIPDPLSIGALPRVDRYLNYRQYIFYVLGNHAYEHQYSQGQLCDLWNGMHACELIADESGSGAYDILLNLHASGANSDAAAADSAEETLPAVGEPVTIKVTLNQLLGAETWSGKVVPVPTQYAGCNVVVRAQRPTVPGGMILDRHYETAEFAFGHVGPSVSTLQQRIIELMLNKIQHQDAAFYKAYLLAHDNYALADNASTAGLPENWNEVVRVVCDRAGLNTEQRECVEHFFSHKITVCVGPPGTGKSTLVDVIYELLAKFRLRCWTCTDSNAAVDVLADKVCKRTRDEHPAFYARIYPAFSEGFTPKEGTVEQRRITWPGEAMGAPVAASGDKPRVMSLEKTIHRRMAAYQAGSLDSRGYWPKERDALAAFKAAVNDLTTAREETEDSPEQLAEDEERARTLFRSCLRKLQVQYILACQGVFSTAAAASGLLLRNLEPEALIMDEGSQMNEARAVFPIVHALKAGKLQRVLIIGDPDQLPPCRLNPRNPASAAGEVSLMETAHRCWDPTNSPVGSVSHGTHHQQHHQQPNLWW